MGATLIVNVFRGGQVIASHQFDSDVNRTIKIGRLPTAQIKLDDPKVSRIHAVLELSGTEVALHDMGTTEGTMVNGARVQNAKLKAGDQITVGDTTLVLAGGAPAMAAAPPPQQAAMPAAMPAGPAFGARPGMPAGPAFGQPGGFGGQPGMPAFGQPGGGFGQPAAPGAFGQPVGPGAFGQASHAPLGRPGATAFVPAMAPAPVAPPPAAPAPASTQPRFDPGAASGAVTPIRRITQERLGTAAVENRPHPALAPERQMTVDNRILELRLYWGEVLLGISHYSKPKKITIGETKKTNIFISSEGLPSEEFPLVRYLDDDYVLTFCGQPMDGEAEVGGQSMSLLELRNSPAARKDDSLADSYQIKLDPGSRAVIHWGGATFALRFVAPAEALPTNFWQNVDLHFLNVAMMSLFFHIALIVTLLVYPYDTESLREDLFDKPDRFASLILEPPKVTDSNKNLMEKIKKEVEAKREELKKPVELPPEPVNKPKPKPDLLTKQVVTPPTVKPRPPTAEEKSQQVKEKFSKLFTGGGAGGGEAGGGSLLGGGGGGSLSGTLAGVIGTAGAGSATAGMAGLGIRGTGPLTGGGVGTSRGIAGIGTAGRLGGGGLGYGSGVGLGGRRERGALDIGPPRIEGALPQEVIKKVIDENRNQIRYCYENELQRNQNLEGRVAMSWIISATGSVATATVRESTLKNDAVEACIIEKIKGWKFPAPAGGGVVTVNYPFIFKST